VALFTPETPYGALYSARVDIRQGKVFLFHGHNVPEGRSIYMCSVSPGSFRPGPHDPPLGADVYIARMDLGGAGSWAIDAAHPRLLVSLPGMYRFELEDPDMLGGDMRLEYRSWDVPWPPFFPVMR
jgi:hypothetical protein